MPHSTAQKYFLQILKGVVSRTYFIIYAFSVCFFKLIEFSEYFILVPRKNNRNFLK